MLDSYIDRSEIQKQKLKIVENINFQISFSFLPSQHAERKFDEEHHNHWNEMKQYFSLWMRCAWTGKSQVIFIHAFREIDTCGVNGFESMNHVSE